MPRSAPHTGHPPLGRRFRFVWASVTVSSLGDGLSFAAFPLLAARISDDPRAVSLVSLAEQIPWLLAGLVSGVLADHLDRRRLLSTTDCLRAAVAGAFAVAVALGYASIPLIVVTAVLLGCGQVVYTGAWNGLVPSLVEPALRTRANAALQASAQVSSAVGAPAGAVLFAAAAAVPFGIHATCFATAALLVAVLPGDFRPQRATGPAPRTRVRREIADGVRWLYRQRILRTLCLASAVANMVMVGLTAVLVLYTRSELHLPDLYYGLFVAAFALGGLIGAASTPRLVARFRPPNLLFATMACSAVLVGATGAVSSGLAAGLLLAGYGAMSLSWNVIAVSLRQNMVPDRLLGRVSMTYQMVVAGASALGAAASGVLGHAYGLRAPFAGGAALLLITAVATAPAIRAILRADPAPDRRESDPGHPPRPRALQPASGDGADDRFPGAAG